MSVVAVASLLHHVILQDFKCGIAAYLHFLQVLRILRNQGSNCALQNTFKEDFLAIFPFNNS